MGIILAILLFSLIIIIHELGHFTLAKLNGIRVDEFSLGMGPTLFGKEFKGTKFSLKLLPLGGACMMGEDDAEHKGDAASASAGGYMSMKAKDEALEHGYDMSRSFANKSVWARIAVIAAGPLFNFILALLMSAILVGAAGYAVPVIQEVESGSSGSEQGLKKGDVITEINGKKIHIYEEFQLYNLTHSTSDTAELTFERDGKEHTIQMEKRQFGDETTKRMGFTYSAEVEKPGFFKSIQYGAYTAKYWVEYTLECLKMLLTGEVGVNQLSGPVGIVEVVNDTYDAAAPSGWSAVILSMMNLGILISANLGVMNLLPIPALDGGRLVFLLIEAVRRKRIAPEKEGMVHFIGFAALMALMVFVMYNDIMRLF